MNINYIKGDATTPIGEDNKIIVHICNDIGGWGKGFVMALSRRWQKPEKEYRAWYASGEGFELGALQLVAVEDNLWVANLIGQHKLRKGADGSPPIRYDAIQKGLKSLGAKAIELNASVHMPRIGCGLAGGKWEEIEPIILDALIDKKVAVTVYDFG